jgi:hypothetical protein
VVWGAVFFLAKYRQNAKFKIKISKKNWFWRLLVARSEEGKKKIKFARLHSFFSFYSQEYWRMIKYFHFISDL